MDTNTIHPVFGSSWNCLKTESGAFEFLSEVFQLAAEVLGFGDAPVHAFLEQVLYPLIAVIAPSLISLNPSS